MRKVITGEQVAQIYNRDPFALPGLAGAGLPDPGRDRAARPALPAAGLAGPAGRPASAGRQRAGPASAHLGQPRLARCRRPGRLGRGSPGGLAVVLAVLVHPLGDRPGAAQVADLVLPAPLGRGHDDRRPGPVVSGPDPAARARQGHRHPVHRPGAGPAGLRAVRRPTSPNTRTTWRTGSARCCAGSAPPSPGRCCWSSSAATPWPPSSPPSRSPPAPTSKRSRSGGARTGCRGWSSCTARMS